MEQRIFMKKRDDEEGIYQYRIKSKYLQQVLDFYGIPEDAVISEGSET